jgi:hypothetical protein
MVLGIFKSIAKIGKKIGHGVSIIGKKVVKFVPKAVDWVRTKAAPVVAKFAKIQGDIAGTLAVPLGVATGQPELTAGLKAIQAGSIVASKLATEIEKPKKAGAKPKPDNPMVMREVAPPQPNPQQIPAQNRPNPFINRGGISGIRMA